MVEPITDEDLARLSDFVAESLGLDFPPARWPDLRRGLSAASRQLGIASAAQCAGDIVKGAPTKKWLDALARALTVGETYFFRDRRSFGALEDRILPWINRHRPNSRYLRIWSAACCTGEEPYSVAILLRQIIPDLEHWNITILATDINTEFLEKAAAGVFSDWSFRETPHWIRKKYFRPLPSGKFEILPEIRRMVQFERLNLVEDVYPSPQNQTNAMDVIFCRNVLMYFTPGQAKKVIHRLHLCQPPGGWLILGPTELAQINCEPYINVNDLGKFLFQRADEIAAPVVTPLPPPPIEIKLPPLRLPMIIPSAPNPSIAARSLANQGQLADALKCCEESIVADPCNAVTHYLRAMILEAQGSTDAAICALRAALYLNPDFVLAHFHLGSLYRRRGDGADRALRHLEIARRLLRRYPPDEVVPESEGITTSRLTQILESLIQVKAAA
jgi:chemotaxis protein methyltransferase CheR